MIRNTHRPYVVVVVVVVVVAVAAESKVIYGKIREAASHSGVSVAPFAEMKAAAAQKVLSGVRPHLVLMHAFYDTKSSTPSPTFGTAIIGGVPGHFATTSWTKENASILCPLGDKRGGGIVEDALGLVSTTNSKLTVKSYSTLKDKGGVLVFDGVGTSALPDCSVELYSKYVSVFKAATGVSAPGYSSGLAYYVEGTDDEMSKLEQLHLFLRCFGDSNRSMVMIQAGNLSPKCTKNSDLGLKQFIREFFVFGAFFCW